MGLSNTIFLNEKNIKSLRPSIQNAKIIATTENESITVDEQLNTLNESNDSKNVIEVFYVSNGELTVTTDETSKTCPSGQMLICAGGVKRTYTYTGENFKAIYLSASDVVIVGFKRESIMNSDVLVVNTSIESVHHESICTLICKEFLEKDSLREEICANLLRALLFKLIQKQQSNTKIKFSPSKDFVSAKSFIDTNFLSYHTIEQLCDGLGINKYHLSRLFKNAISMSPARYLLQKKLDHAKFLLINSNKNIYEIAKECDLGRTENFCKLFKKNCLVTPLNYRFHHKHNNKT